MQKERENIQRLYDFPSEVRGRICGYDNEEMQMPIKIIEMGLLPDTELIILRRAPFGGPMYIEYGEEKTRVALRVEEAKFILIELVKC